MIIFGLTGGIGSGKSTVSKTIVEYGIPVVDADVVARQVAAPHSLGLTSIIDAFGLRFLQKDGNLDRAALGAFVFSDPAALQQLNVIMAPLIQQEVTRQFNSLQSLGHRLACYDGALLIEAGNVEKYRPLIVVHCTPEQQLERLLLRGLTREQAMNRIACQMPTAHKLQLADFAIDTSSTKEASIKQTEMIISYLMNLIRCEACELEQQMDVLIVEPEHTCMEK